MIFFGCILSAMDQLQRYLNTGGNSARQLAILVGVSPAFISMLRHGQKTPSLAVAFAIEDATGGAVPARSWLDT
jgi:transcriptional regulator with XRE-family HTH domain